MPSEPAAGLLLFRRSAGGIEALLFHRSGPSFVNRTKGAWTIAISRLPAPEPSRPEPGAGFQPRRRVKPRLAAARLQDALKEHARARTAALVGAAVPSDCSPLGGVKMRGHRVVYVWACEDRSGTEPILAQAGDQAASPSADVSERLAYDRVAYVSLSEARTFIDSQQRRFLDQLEGLISSKELLTT